MILARPCTGNIAMPGVRDRVAVVTGAANGLGREIALLLAREGARVAHADVVNTELLAFIKS
jgi:3-hydroxybutyrate dehydrogenase